MTIRALLAFLFILSAAVLTGSLVFVGWILFSGFHAALPVDMMLGSALVPTMPIVSSLAALFLLIMIAIFGILFFLIDHNIAEPIRSLLHTLETMTEPGAHVTLPNFPHSTIEINRLSESFLRFTDSIEQAHQRDTDVSRVKSDFISTAAHQLRTPLTGIRWALEALQNEALTEGQKGLVKNAVDKSHDLVAIVGTLLDISSIESGKYKYVFTPTDLDAIVSGIAQDFVVLAEKNKVTLFYAKSGIAIPTLNLDKDRIKWLLNNLVENAIRYTPAGGSVQISVELSANRVYVKVRDTGIGIPSKDRNNIFERFFRAGNAISKENQGNGLGLYIARQIAIDHGGDLSFEANENSTGTTFILALPLPQTMSA